MLKLLFFSAAKSPLAFAPLPPSPTLWGLRGQYKRPCFVFTRAHVTFRGSKEAAKTSFRFSSGDGRVTWRAVVGAVGGKVVDEGRPVTKPSRQGEAASGRRQRRRVVSVVVRRTARPADVRSYARRQLVEPTEQHRQPQNGTQYRAHTAENERREKHRPSGTRCHKQFSSATLCLLLNVDLKLFFIHSGNRGTLIGPAASVSEVTTVWRYIIRLLLLLLLHCALSLAAKCIVIGPVCNGRAGVVGLWLFGSVTTIT